jgi:NitT/TauT family transport system ATP-binding protein
MVSPDAANEPAIVAEGVSKLFLEGTVVAFHQLSLAVKRDEIMCVVGPSGCGKTTLLRSIAGLTDVSSGKLLVHGKPVAGRPPDGVAMVFQHFGLLPWKTVYDNAAFGLAVAGVPRDRIRERVAHYLELVGLTGFEAHYPYQLSGGMQQRVGLVRALAMNPSILLMDEPFAALDAQTREILQEELLALMERPDERKTMVFITHSIDEAILLGDRIAVMSARPGRIKEVLDMPFGWPRVADAVRADPRFTEFRLHLWHQLHTSKPRNLRHQEVARPSSNKRAAPGRWQRAGRSVRRSGARRARRGCPQASPPVNLAIRVVSLAIALTLWGGRLERRSGVAYLADQGGGGGVQMVLSGELWTIWPSLVVLGTASRSRWWNRDRTDARALGVDVALTVYITFLYLSLGRVGAADRAVGRFRHHRQGHHPVLFAFFPDGDQHPGRQASTRSCSRSVALASEGSVASSARRARSSHGPAGARARSDRHGAR